MPEGDSNFSGKLRASAERAVAISSAVIGFDGGQGVELLEDLLERRGRGVGPDRGRHAPDAPAAVEGEGRAGAVGVAVLLAEVLVQAAEEILAEQVVADQGRHVAGIAPVDPAPADVDHALHRAGLVDEVDRPRLVPGCDGRSWAGPGVVGLPAAERLLQHLRDGVGIDVAGDDERGALRARSRAAWKAADVVEGERLDRLGIALRRACRRGGRGRTSGSGRRGGRSRRRCRGPGAGRRAAGSARGRSPWGRTGETRASRRAGRASARGCAPGREAPTPMSSAPAATRTPAPSSSNASASSVAVFVFVPWSSSRAVRLARPDLPSGSSPVPTGTWSETCTSGNVFQGAIQTSIPLDERLPDVAGRAERHAGSRDRAASTSRVPGPAGAWPRASPGRARGGSGPTGHRLGLGLARLHRADQEPRPWRRSGTARPRAGCRPA